MAQQRGALWWLAGVLLATAMLGPCAGQMMGMGGEPEPRALAVKSDIQYIRCGVCSEMAKQAHRMVKSMREALKPGKRLSEADIIDRLETFCDPEKEGGEWITQIDLVEDGTSLTVVDKGAMSKCNTECATVARACEQIHEQLDLSELSEALYAGKGRSALVQKMCYEDTIVCKRKAPPLPSDRQPGPQHEPMSAKDIEAAKIMKQMKGMGMGAQLYDRDQMLKQAEAELAYEKEQRGEEDDLALEDDTASAPQDDLLAGKGAAVAGAGGSVVGKASSLFKGALGKLSAAFGRGSTEQQEL